jgi:hypothetical protein
MRGMGLHPGMRMKVMSECCCTPYEQSKETRVKQLEAMKSHLQDYIGQIDKQIEELQTEKKEEA